MKHTELTARDKARIAELEEALTYHQEQTRPISKTIDALANKGNWLADHDARYEAKIARLVEVIHLFEANEIGKDWACKECHPESDILVDDFLCKRHLALKEK